MKQCSQHLLAVRFVQQRKCRLPALQISQVTHVGYESQVSPFESNRPCLLPLQVEPAQQQLTMALHRQNTNTTSAVRTHGCVYDAWSIGINRDSMSPELQRLVQSSVLIVADEEITIPAA